MATTTPRMKNTYATLTADNEELQAAYDHAVDEARARLGRSYPMLIGAEERTGDEWFEDRSPNDADIVVSRFPVGTRQDVRDAIDAARAAFPAWRDLGWRKFRSLPSRRPIGGTHRPDLFGPPPHPAGPASGDRR